jgi:excisionase family DNA binding protein
MRKPRPDQVSIGPRPSKNDLPELARLGQFGAVMGLTDRQVRGLISKGRLEYVEIGRRLFVPKSAVDRFIAENTVQSCRDETQGHVSASLKSEAAFTSAGPKLAAAGSAARARQIANELKSLSPNSSASVRAPAAPVIRLKSS